MTQDQYGQAQSAGYGARGDVVEDENDDYADDSGKPMTRFQKVASALRGDRTDPEEVDDDQMAANRDGVASPTATGPDAATDPGEVTDPDLVTDSDAVTDQDVAYNSGRAANSDVAANSGAAPNEPAETGPGARRGNYWDDSDTAAAGQAEAAAVMTPDVPVAGPDAANGYA